MTYNKLIEQRNVEIVAQSGILSHLKELKRAWYHIWMKIIKT